VIAALLLGLCLAPGATQDAVELPVPALARTEQRALVLPRAQPGTWDGFFVDHEADPAQVASIEPRLLRLGEWAGQAYAQADYPTALALCLDQLALLADFPPALLMLGTTCFRLRRYQDCRLALERFLQVAPSELWRTQVLGHALYGLGLPAAGRDHYRALLEVFPGSVEARRGLGLCLFQLGDFEAAAAELERVLEARPEHAEAWSALARVRFDQERLEEARVAAQRARELAPFEPAGFFIGFRVLYELGEDEQGERLEQRWRELSDAAGELASLRNRLLHAPGSAGLLRTLAERLAELGDREALEPILRRLLALPATGAQALDRALFVVTRQVQCGDLVAARANLAALTETHGDEPGVQALVEQLAEHE
jgi:tetratricopeptide (TPR) repeat protein